MRVDSEEDGFPHLDGIDGRIKRGFLGLSLVQTADGMLGVLLALFLQLAEIDAVLALRLGRTGLVGRLREKRLDRGKAKTLRVYSRRQPGQRRLRPRQQGRPA